MKETLTQVKKLIASGQVWRGYMVGNNVNQGNIWSGMHFGMYIELSTIEQLEETKNSYLLYLDRELGTYVSWYHTKKNVSR